MESDDRLTPSVARRARQATALGMLGSGRDCPVPARRVSCGMRRWLRRARRECPSSEFMEPSTDWTVSHLYRKRIDL
jgi:hypothetical protein